MIYVTTIVLTIVLKDKVVTLFTTVLKSCHTTSSVSHSLWKVFLVIQFSTKFSTLDVLKNGFDSPNLLASACHRHRGAMLLLYCF